ncbi:hypothetical protein DH2020_015736 [Rehmannia glutinosa]|uniref:Disease resistance N-terminal domain-containing protein n=1 Tax=Rehmannia glutinosa TaxID=99300 RepID=A0ABR0WUK2_REHGL
MENTASSSMETRLKILQQIITWKFKPDLIYHEVKVAWTEAHLSALLDYVLKLEGITRSKFSAYNSEILERFEPQNSEKLPEMIVCFMKDLGILFEVPKLIQFSSDNENNLNKNEILAAFMDFLLQLLYHRIASMIPFEDCIDCLEKELHFLVTVLGDTPLINVGAHLLTEFEAVANDAGSLVYSLVFLSDHLIIDNELDALLKRIHHLKLSISKFLYLLPFITNVDINTPNTSVSVDSLFILDSLLYDLDDLVNQEGCPIVDVKDQIKILRQELMLSQSLLKGIRVPPHSDIQELNQTVMRIREAAYEAEYLVNSFLARYAPAWYLTTRLTHVINKIKHIETLLQEIKQNYDIGDLKVSEDVSSPQIPLQAKKNFDLEILYNYSIYQKNHRLLSPQYSPTPFFGNHVRSFRGNCLGSEFYLGSMKLLRVLDYEHTFGSARLIGTEFLVNLRYLVINELPTSIGSLVNLEYLRVDNDKYVHISLLLKMKKLRYLEVTRLSLFKNDGDSSETNNLEVVSRIVIEYLKDEETLKCSPHLRKLKCECDPLFFLENECDPLCIQKKGVYGYRYPDLRFLTKLESLNMTALHGGKIMEINFPSNIKKLTLDWFSPAMGKDVEYWEIAKP